MPTDELAAARRRLSAIDDEIRSLRGDAFAVRHELRREADALRASLRKGSAAPTVRRRSGGW